MSVWAHNLQAPVWAWRFCFSALAVVMGAVALITCSHLVHCCRIGGG